ncbi:GFA family protein [Bauldia sp.]|uniref:GFA family protein n=1 Tax=Bauldia sp. TaxID=2575872 RepID=UPI003BA9D67C
MLTGTCHCGDVRWALDSKPESVTACSCTICRRYGALWAYGHIDHDIQVSGPSKAYRRKDGGAIDFYFCPRCGCLTHYIATGPGEDGKRWTGVNLRMLEPDAIADLPIDHFDGLDTWDDLPRDGRTVRDMWF